MTGRLKRMAVAGAGLALVLSASGCSRSLVYTGYVPDQTLVSSIAPGVDNRQSVQATLGRPTFEGQFSANDWYYVSRQSRQLAFSPPSAVSQSVLHVRFDDAGNVASVNTTGLDQIARVDPTGRTTPTLGRERGFFEEIFGNIGRVGAGGLGAPDGSNTGRNN